MPAVENDFFHFEAEIIALFSIVVAKMRYRQSGIESGGYGWIEGNIARKMETCFTLIPDDKQTDERKGKNERLNGRRRLCG